MLLKKIITTLVLCVTLCISVSYSATGVPTKQGVGLVMSGGGAKGLYHVGVIRALEEHGIPIDYISGASMGAVVGGLYSAGWSPERMWEFFATDTVSMWLSGKIPTQYNSYYTQFRPKPELVGVNIIADTTLGKNALQVPTNLISPYMLDIAITEMMSPASNAAGGDFDSLFVPFRCTATDIYRKELVEFSQGTLPLAVRASMTIPFVFRPISIDSALLYDSGVLNNFPVQLLEKDFNPQNIIGSVCVDNYTEPEQNNITNQVMSLSTRITDYNVPNPETDIMLRHVIREYTIMDYHKATEIMEIGYQDAIAQMAEIKSKITTHRPKSEVEKRRKEFKARIPELTFDSVIITGLTPAQTKYVQRQLGVNKLPSFTYEYFYDRYMRIIATGTFTSNFPRMEYNPQTGYYRIHLDMQTKGSMRFSLGGNISSTSLNQGHVAFTFKQTTQVASTYRVDGDFGMYHNAIKLSGSHQIYTNRPYYLDYSTYIEGLNHDGGNMSNYYRDTDWRYLYQQNIGVDVSAAIPIFKSSAFRLSGTLKNSLYKYFENVFTNKDTASYSTFNHIKISSMIETNSLNYTMFANRGTRQKVELRYTAGLEDFSPGSIAGQYEAKNIKRWWVEARYVREQYVPIARWLTLGYLVDVALSNQPKFTNSLITSITAPHFAPTPQANAMFIREFSATSYAAGGVMPIINILPSRQFYLKSFFYTFIPDTLFGIDKPEQITDMVKFIYGATLVYQTAIGPASLNISKYTTGPNNWAVQFNFGYVLFKNH